MKVNYDDEVEFDFENSKLRIWVNTGGGFCNIGLNRTRYQRHVG